MSGFRFSARSYARLVGVRPELVAVATRALALTEVDFGVIEGVRSIERQRELLRSGASHTINSKHLSGHAIDVAAYMGGELRWDWPLVIKIAAAMQCAGEHLGVRLRWGGTWAELGGGAVPSLADLHKGFPDGAHYELLS